jgi:hypothetical protein
LISPKLDDIVIKHDASREPKPERDLAHIESASKLSGKFELEADDDYVEKKSPEAKKGPGTNQQKPKFELEPDDDYNDADFDQEDKALRESQPERNLNHIKTAS